MHSNNLKKATLSVLVFSILLLNLFWQTTDKAYAALSIDQIINEYPNFSTADSSADLIEVIKSRISKLLQENKHRDYPGVMVTEDLNKFMWFKGIEVYALSSTLPLLDIPTQNSLKIFLKYEVDNYLLNSAYRDFEFSGNLNTKLPGSNIDWNHGYDAHATGAPTWESLYGLWAYAHYTGDWTTIQTNWTNITSNIYDRGVNDVKKGLARNVYSISYNSELAGRIGYARMARKLFAITSSSTYQSRYNSTVTSINSRISSIANNINHTHTQGQICFWYSTDCGRDNQSNLPQFDTLTPELGRWLKENYLSQTTSVINNVETAFKWWYLSSYNIGGATGGEGYFQPPLFAYEIFQAKAEVINTPVSELRAKLPWVNEFASVPVHWDILNYLNMLALVRKSENIIWTDTNTPPSNVSVTNVTSIPTPTRIPTPTNTFIPTIVSYKQYGDANGDGKVDLSDLSILAQNWMKIF
jgi:hypothetical protein